MTDFFSSGRWGRKSEWEDRSAKLNFRYVPQKKIKKKAKGFLEKQNGHRFALQLQL
jgi:hypothetical protein